MCPQVNTGCPSCVRHRPVDLEAAVQFVDVAGAGGRLVAPHGGPVEKCGVPESLGPHERIGRSGERRTEELRDLERDVEMVEHAHAGGVVTTVVGDALGFLRQGLSTFERAAVGKFGAQRRQDECTFRNAIRQVIEGGLEHLDLLAVGGADRAVEAAVVGQGGGDQPLGVTELGRPMRGFEQGVTKGRVAGLALRRSQPDDQVEGQDGVGVVDLLQKLVWPG